MVKISKQKDKELYKCEECGFHYESKETAEKCEAWCREHQSCNIEITAQALENRKKFIAPPPKNLPAEARARRKGGVGGIPPCPSEIKQRPAPPPCSSEQNTKEKFCFPFRRKKIVARKSETANKTFLWWGEQQLAAAGRLPLVTNF